MQMVQTRLTRMTPTGQIETTAWLPVDRRVRRGTVLSLDHARDVLWTVAAQYSQLDRAQLYRGWGLGLPPAQRTER